ncbi:hypothetical protein AB0J86_21460 [Micromonospora sp. NPDC049559]|uniref:hypothetical protein n=1 Tax=Micromonospora sp. NPDC049559 TaxID=3155923 RepID=UPI003437A21E
MISIAALVAVAGLALSGCGQDGRTGGGSTPPPTASGGPSLSNPPSPPNPLSPSPPVAKSPPPRTPGSPQPTDLRTLTGTVTAGVEANCVLLDNFLLVGGPRDVLRPGARVSVTGRVQSDLMTTCQQGTPFVVQSAKPA